MLKRVLFRDLFISIGVLIEKVIPDKEFIIQCHGKTGQHYNQSIELNVAPTTLNLTQKNEIIKRIGLFDISTRNMGRYGDIMVLHYNSKNCKT